MPNFSISIQGGIHSRKLHPDIGGKFPPMVRAEDSYISCSGTYLEGVKVAVEIVRIFVASMRGHVQIIRTFDQVQLIDVKGDLAGTFTFQRLELFNVCVGSITTNALGAEHSDSKNKIFYRLPRA